MYVLSNTWNSDRACSWSWWILFYNIFWIQRAKVLTIEKERIYWLIEMVFYVFNYYLVHRTTGLRHVVIAIWTFYHSCRSIHHAQLKNKLSDMYTCQVRCVMYYWSWRRDSMIRIMFIRPRWELHQWSIISCGTKIFIWIIIISFSMDVTVLIVAKY